MLRDAKAGRADEHHEHGKNKRTHKKHAIVVACVFHLPRVRPLTSQNDYQHRSVVVNEQGGQTRQRTIPVVEHGTGKEVNSTNRQRRHTNTTTTKQASKHKQRQKKEGTKKKQKNERQQQRQQQTKQSGRQAKPWPTPHNHCTASWPSSKTHTNNDII